MFLNLIAAASDNEVQINWREILLVLAAAALLVAVTTSSVHSV